MRILLALTDHLQIPLREGLKELSRWLEQHAVPPARDLAGAHGLPKR